jgi:hypothetical protein
VRRERAPISSRPGQYHSIDRFIMPKRFSRAIETPASSRISAAA